VKKTGSSIFLVSPGLKVKAIRLDGPLALVLTPKKGVASISTLLTNL
jgi:hypothetical protein